MYSLRCTKKLLDRIKPSIAISLPPPTTVLGNWYATALFWKPQLALLVNERTLLPVLMTLAPASTLAARFPVELATVLSLHGARQALIESEVAVMGDVAFAKTANRSIVGTMNEFSFLVEGYREYLETSDLVTLSMRLANTPCIRSSTTARRGCSRSFSAMRYADHLQREYVADDSAQHVAGHPVRALASWVARWVARQRQRRPMHRNLLILKEFLAMRPQYDIVQI